MPMNVLGQFGRAPAAPRSSLPSLMGPAPAVQPQRTGPRPMGPRPVGPPAAPIRQPRQNPMMRQRMPLGALMPPQRQPMQRQAVPAPVGPRRPDASGVVPPANTPGYQQPVVAPQPQPAGPSPLAEAGARSPQALRVNEAGPHGGTAHAAKKGGADLSGLDAGQLAQYQDDPGGLDAYLASVGIDRGSKAYNKVINYMNVYAKHAGADPTGQGKVYKRTAGKLDDLSDWMTKHGGDIGGYGAPAPGGGGGNDGGVDPFQDVTDTTQDPTTGDWNLGEVDPNAAKSDWMFSDKPDLAQIQLAWLANQQARSDREAAVNAYGGLEDYLNNDPTRQAMYDFLGEGPHISMDEDTIRRMKGTGREQYADALTSMDQDSRAMAGQAGVPTSDLAGLRARTRGASLRDLLGNERNIDIQGALSKGQDLSNYYGQLNAAQGALVGPMASYYGGLAGLLAGTPGLAQTGNPMAGIPEYRLAYDQANQGPTGMDRMGGYAGMAGGGMQALGPLMSLFA
jgi:hypothetical protein